MRTSTSKDRMDLAVRGRAGAGDASKRSASKEAAQPQFGRERSGSRGRLGLNFGAKADKDMIKLDPSMTTIKKTELEELKKEIDAKKDEVYAMTIKKKEAENKVVIMERDHKDALDKMEVDLTEANKRAQEEMLQKHAAERNNLIAESNKSNDEKFNQLMAQHDTLKAESKAAE